MKATYKNAEIQIISLETQDVICASDSVASSYKFGVGDIGRSDRLEDVG